MTPETYRLLHVVGVLLLFLGLGGILASAGKDGGKAPRTFQLMHGIGLLVMLIAGIGFAHKSAISLGSPWLLSKMAIWVILAAMPTLVRKGVLPRVAALILIIALGAAAAWLARAKPY